jgi:DNA-directed RNA polymerase specialized sigma24 family protein
VVNETFTTAWRHWGRRPADGQLLPRLYAIAGNVVRDQHRSARRRTRLAARLSAAGDVGHAADPADVVVLGRSVGEAFARLPAADREVLQLVAWEGLEDARSVGLAMGLSAAAARVRIHRARKRLRGLLAEVHDRPPGPTDRRPVSHVRSHVSEA